MGMNVIPANATRVIDRYEGQLGGPLVIVLTAMHGNEPAGVEAVQDVFRLLSIEPLHNPDFCFQGKLVGMIGNLRAFKARQRYLTRDLNRLWLPEQVEDALEHDPAELSDEWLELVELTTAIRHEIEVYRPQRLVIIDIHTTSADGGIFTIPLETDPDSLQLAQELYAPVVRGLLDGLQGTMMHFAAGNYFAINGYPENTACVAFEAGQHNDPLSVSRAIAAIVNGLRGAGCVRPQDVDSRHDIILKNYAADLPALTRIVHVHHIDPDEMFRMEPGYVNFQPVKAGEVLAKNNRGLVTAPCDGYILMPLYQPQGTDGFFIVV
jgi:succinylglutamate desuccinylase